MNFFCLFENFEYDYGNVEKYFEMIITNGCLDYKNNDLKELFILENEFVRFRKNYLNSLNGFVNKYSCGIDALHNTYSLFVFCLKSLFTKKFYFINYEFYEARVKNVWEAIDFLLEIKNKNIIVPKSAFMPFTSQTDLYHFIAYHFNFMTTIYDTDALSRIIAKCIDLKNCIFNTKGKQPLFLKIESILQSKVIQAFYNRYDDTCINSEGYIIPELIKKTHFGIKSNLLKILMLFLLKHFLN